jgi:hypothetical protein
MGSRLGTQRTNRTAAGSCSRTVFRCLGGSLFSTRKGLCSKDSIGKSRQKHFDAVDLERGVLVAFDHILLCGLWDRQGESFLKRGS